jgi:hypothetical protein
MCAGAGSQLSWQKQYWLSRNYYRGGSVDIQRTLNRLSAEIHERDRLHEVSSAPIQPKATGHGFHLSGDLAQSTGRPPGGFELAPF